MCRRVQCSRCGRPTFAGCGMHVEQVLGNVPKDQRCRCHEKKHEEKSESGGSSWRSKLFGR